MSALFGLWRLLPGAWRTFALIGTLIALLGSIWGLYAYVKHQGYTEGYAVMAAKCERDKQLQEAANQEAIRIAAEDYFKAIDRLQLQNEEYDDAIEEIDAATAADPAGGELCLGADSVLRLNGIN